MRTRVILALFLGLSGSMGIQTAMGQASPEPVAGQVNLGVDVTTLDWIAVGYRASKILKSNVYNEQDKKIGDVADLIIKPDGSISVAVLEVGGFLGMGKHHVAIPIGRFTNVSSKLVLAGATKESLKALPQFQFAKSST